MHPVFNKFDILCGILKGESLKSDVIIGGEKTSTLIIIAVLFGENGKYDELLPKRVVQFAECA
jgi:hypothetical protein